LTNNKNYDIHLPEKQKIERVMKRLNVFLVNTDYGELIIKKRAGKVCLIETRETELI